jgi:hypothetical protein
VRSVVLALAALLFGSGCLHRDALEDADYAPGPEPAASPPVVVKDVDVASDDDDDAADDDATDIGRAASARRVTWLPASSKDHPQPDPIPFRLGAGHGMLGRVDLRPCRDRGLPVGYLHMHVTFRRNGRVVHATVETEAPPPQEALTCISEQLELAMVPAFDGSDVTLSKSFFVN